MVHSRRFAESLLIKGDKWSLLQPPAQSLKEIWNLLEDLSTKRGRLCKGQTWRRSSQQVVLTKRYTYIFFCFALEITLVLICVRTFLHLFLHPPLNSSKISMHLSLSSSVTQRYHHEHFNLEQLATSLTDIYCYISILISSMLQQFSVFLIPKFSLHASLFLLVWRFSF